MDKLRDFGLWVLTRAPSGEVLAELWEAASPDMPDTLACTPADASLLPAAVPARHAKHFTFDEGHAGRFTVFGARGASLAAGFVLAAQPSPLRYVEETLAVGERSTGEVVVFSPGLNTVHEPRDGEMTAPDRCEHYVRVLGGRRMAHLHTGTSMDQPDVRVPAETALLVQAACAAAGIAGVDAPEVGEDGALVMTAPFIDQLQVVGSMLNAVDTPLKKSLRGVLRAALDEAKDGRVENPLVLMCYSRGSLEVAAALRWLIDEEADGWDEDEEKEELEKLLRAAVTVVTLGNASRNFPDGPAYVHVSAAGDLVTASAGVTAERPGGAGRDAVFVEVESAWEKSSGEPHNASVVTSQYLEIMLAYNEQDTYRGLWEAAQRRGGLRVPRDAKELTAALVVLTLGKDWLWNPEKACEGVPPLPRESEARELLADVLGERFVEDVERRFEGVQPPSKLGLSAKPKYLRCL